MADKQWSLSSSLRISSKADRHDEMVSKGVALHQADRFKEAEYCYQLVLRENPEHPDALHLMGLLAIEADQAAVAIDYLSKAVKLDPKNAIYQNNLGNAYCFNMQAEKGLPHLKKAVRLDKKYVDAYCNLGRAYRTLGEPDLAEPIFQRCLRVSPGDVRALTLLAEMALERGDLAHAAESFEAILAEHPEELFALTGLAGARKAAKDDPLLKLLRRKLDEPDLKDLARAALHHALGKAYNDICEYEDAIYHYRRGKEYSRYKFPMAVHRNYYAALKEALTKDFFAAREGYGLPDERPVFVVGMPRSGTTLTEQIISSHGAVHGLGERPDMRRIIRGLHYGQNDPKLFLDAISALDRDKSRELANTYLEAYGRAPGSAERIVDKLPHNYETLSLISLLFPNAHIIHCRRDPMDTCVSCYMHNFSEAHAYNNNLAVLGEYYREYDGLMAHWHSVVPLKILDNQYEEMVAGQEAATRRLIDFLGLEWDDACLRYFETDRLVSTPSRWQVRQPIYSSSVKRWKRYDSELGPLKTALGDLFVDGP